MDSDTAAGASTPLLSSNHIPQYRAKPPTSSSTDTQDLDNKDRSLPTKRQLGFYDGVVMVLCTQIGSGIFISPSLVVLNSGSKSVALVTWLLAGMLTWACALCYVELGVRMPLNGGPQEYLAYCFNDLAAFLVSWGTIFALKPCTAALLAVFVSEYFCDALNLTEPLPVFYRKLISLGALAVLTFINCAGNTQSRVVTKLLLGCKISGIIFVLALSLSPVVFPGNTPLVPRENIDIFPSDWSNYSDAILQALYAFSGWETLAFIGGELKNPQRIIAPVTNVSMIIVIFLFVLANVAYFSALSFEEIIHAATIAITYAEHFMGRAGGLILATFICLSGLGSLNVKIYTASRVTQAAAERGHLPALLETVARTNLEESHEERDNGTEQPPSRWAGLHRPTQYKDGTIPFSAILFNTTLSFIYILIGDLSDLVIFTGIVEYSIVFLTICGLLSLRRKPQNSGIGLGLFQVPHAVVFLALVTTLFILCVSVAKHPFAGFGYIGFCMVTMLIHKYLVRE